MFCPLNLLFCEDAVAVAVVVFFNSVIKHALHTSVLYEVGIAVKAETSLSSIKYANI